MNQSTRCFSIFFLLLTCLAITKLTHAQTTYQAALNGRQEAMPVTSPAYGQINATLSGTVLTVSGSFSGLMGDFDASIAGGSHIHNALAGQNGDIELTLTPTLDGDLKGGTFEAINNGFSLTTDQIAALNNRELYVNIHTTAFASGELRGQIAPTGDDQYFINLSGSNEVPSIMTQANGALFLDVDNDQLTVTGSFQNLEGDFDASIAGGAHLHMALAGSNGGISISLTPTPDADLKGGVFTAADNTFTLDAAQMAALEARSLYANLHTTAHAPGELRGQSVGTAQTVFRAHLSGNNEIPVVTSGAQGTVLAELHDTTLIVSGSFSGLESPVDVTIAGGAHIHGALAGSNGDVNFLLTSTLDGDMLGGTFEAADNVFELTQDQLAALYDRGMYINIHTTGNGPGELRGQLLPESQFVMNGFLSGIYTVPSVTTTALGGVKAEFIGDQLTVSGSFAGLSSAVDVSIAGGAHLHLAPAGSTGDVAFVLTPSLDTDMLGGTFEAADNTFTLDAGQIANLRARGFYVNIHTLNNAPGELRAQLLHEANAYFVAPLGGTSHSPAVNTGGTGMLALEWTGDQIIGSGSFSGLTGDFDPSVAGGAHIHEGLAGQSGGIAFGLTTETGGDLTSGEFAAKDNVFTVTDGQIDSLRARMNYINIHTTTNAAGEIRGQLLPLATVHMTTSLDAFNEVQPAASPATGSMKFELNGTNLSVSGAFSGLTGAFDPNVAGGSHIHMAVTGMNGDIMFTLVAELSGDMLSGWYLAEDNTFELTDDQLTALLAGEFYINIHTEAIASGELRGQILPEINFFPTASAAIVTPASGTMVTIEGDPITPFTATWTAADDANTLSYIWQLAADDAFSTILFEQNVGTSTTFTTDFGTVDGLLDGAGVTLGNSATLYHRAVASDGSVWTAGAGSDVELTRGVITGLRPELSDAFQLQVLPNITNNAAEVQLRISVENESGEGQLMLSNAWGQQLFVQPILLNEGTHTYSINLPPLAAGFYSINLSADGKMSKAERFIIQN